MKISLVAIARQISFIISLPEISRSFHPCISTHFCLLISAIAVSTVSESAAGAAGYATKHFAFRTSATPYNRMLNTLWKNRMHINVSFIFINLAFDIIKIHSFFLL
jgi:hypothetical protein